MISYSLSFGARARCRYCTSEPMYESYILNNLNTFKDVQDLLKSYNIYLSSRRSIYDMTSPSNFLFLPKNGTKLSLTSFGTNFSSVKIKQSKFDEKSHIFKFNLIYFCSCEKSSWLTKSMLRAKHDFITERFSIKNYPKKLILL